MKLFRNTSSRRWGREKLYGVTLIWAGPIFILLTKKGT